MPLAKDVATIEGAFIDLLQHIPGTKEEKQAYFKDRGIQVPRTNYESMWEGLAGCLHRSGAASAVFEFLRSKMSGRVGTLLRTAKKGKPVSLYAADPVIVDDLFFRNGNLRKLGELFLEELESRGVTMMRTASSQSAGATKVKSDAKPYEIALSFAGEDRALVERIANVLDSGGIKVFYDRFEEVSMWGKDLTAHLADIYKNRANYCAMFVSIHYVSKAWPQLERQHALSRALIEKREYILPIKLDESEVPGLPSTICAYRKFRSR